MDIYTGVEVAGMVRIGGMIRSSPPYEQNFFEVPGYSIMQLYVLIRKCVHPFTFE